MYFKMFPLSFIQTMLRNLSLTCFTGKKRKASPGLICVNSEEEDAYEPSRKKASRVDIEKKNERRQAVEQRFQQQGLFLARVNVSKFYQRNGGKG